MRAGETGAACGFATIVLEAGGATLAVALGAAASGLLGVSRVGLATGCALL